MRRAIAWLCSALVTVGGLLVESWGLFPEIPWTLAALLGFFVFSGVSYLTIASLEAQLNAKPVIRVDASDNERNNRIIEIMEPDPATRRMVHAHDAFFKLVTVYATSYAKSCTVKVTRLSQNGQPCPGFVPSALRWFGRDGEGAESKNFFGMDFVLLLSRRPDRPEWQLQAPLREGTGARLWYGPGEYEVELMVSAENTLRVHVVSGVLSIGPKFDEINFVRTKPPHGHPAHAAAVH
jgi:hypothetical protein